MNRIVTFSSRRALLSAAMIVGLAASPALALDDGKENMFDSLSSLLGMGADRKAPDIDYRERAPLVLPPKMQLRQPGTRAETRDANWPQDPDVLRRQKEAEQAKLPLKFYSDKNDMQMRKQDLMGGRASVGQTYTPGAINQDGCRYTSDGTCLWVSPDVLRSTGIKEDKTKVTGKVGEEPQRNWLTEPPKGYRKVTQATGAGPQRRAQDIDEANPYSFWRKLNPFADEE